jgi:hypothetical protein
MPKALVLDKNVKPDWVVKQLRRAKQAQRAISSGVLGPHYIYSITATGQFIGEPDWTIHEFIETLKKSKRVFRQGNAVIFLAGSSSPGDKSCSPKQIVVEDESTTNAPAILGNSIMCCAIKANAAGKGKRPDPNQPDVYVMYFVVPKRALDCIVSRDGFAESFPEIRYFFNHPVFDHNFQWLESGYHEEHGILVCGDSFEPCSLDPVETPPAEGEATIEQILDLLPPMTREWVAGFHWNRPVDLINYLGAALMIPLMPLLVKDGHPGVIFWGNQPGIGKSLAAQCLSVLKDGQQASPTSVDQGSRELENQIASELNDGRTVLFIDNLKGELNSASLEASITSSTIGIRGFRVQQKLRRPNDILWLFTTNEVNPSDDILTRSIHIRLRYEGLPDTHRFKLSEEDLIAHVENHRADILAELAGMVVRWLDEGMPISQSPSRFQRFGKVVGSVLACSGLNGFLSNAREEVQEHSTKHHQLADLVERLIVSRAEDFIWEVENIDSADDEFKRRDKPTNPKEQKDWTHYVSGVGGIPATFDTPQKQKTAVTQFMNGILKVPVEVDIGDKVYRAMMVSRPLRSRRTAYVLAVQELPSLDASEAVAWEAVSDEKGPTAADQVTAEELATEIQSPAANAEPNPPSDEVQEGGLWGD